MPQVRRDMEGLRLRLDGWESPGRRLLDRANDGIGVQLLALHQAQDRQAHGLHVLRQMDGELLPRRQCLSAETAGLVLRFLSGVVVALLDLLPGDVRCTCSLHCGLGLDPGLRELVLSDEMLEEVVSAVTSVSTVFNVALPPFEMLSAVLVRLMERKGVG